MVDLLLMNLILGWTGLGRFKIEWTGRAGHNRTGVDMGGLRIVLSEPGWMRFPKPQFASSLGEELQESIYKA